MSDPVIYFGMQRTTRGLSPVTYREGVPKRREELEYLCRMAPQDFGKSLIDLANAYWAARNAGTLPPNLLGSRG